MRGGTISPCFLPTTGVDQLSRPAASLTGGRFRKGSGPPDARSCPQRRTPLHSDRSLRPFPGLASDELGDVGLALRAHCRNQATLDSIEEIEATEHQRGIELDRIGAGLEFLERRLGRMNAAHSDDRQA